MRALLVVLVLVAGCASPGAPSGQSHSSSSGRPSAAHPTLANTGNPGCPGHTHASFALFLPGADGGPRRVDFAAPRTASGAPYYQLGQASTMTVAVHLHQSGSESGSAALGPAQFHYESGGPCITVGQSLAAVEVNATSARVRLWGGHALAHQDGTWEANATQRVRWWSERVPHPDGPCAWTWQERTLEEIRPHAPADGESLLVALGSFTVEEVHAMQAQVPAPMSRAAPYCK